MKSIVLTIIAFGIGQTPPSKVALERECKGVPEDKLTVVRQSAEDKAKSGATAGAVTRAAREAAKAAGVAENCAVEIARFEFAEHGKDTRPRNAAGKLITKSEAELIAAWDALSDTERDWRVWQLQSQTQQQPLTWHSLRVGARGYLDCELTTLAVLAENEVLVDCKGGVIEGGGFSSITGTAAKYSGPKPYIKLGEPKGLWLIGVKSNGATTGQSFGIAGPLKVTGTKAYETPTGGIRTVLVAEVVELDLDKLAGVVPPQSVLDKLRKSSEK